MKEMVGGCCVCSDERGWSENPLVYCDGQNCTVAVHQACYGIVTVPTGPWYCRKCESQERSARVRCELCPSKDGALKKTDNQGWAHVVCALYIPEVRFGNVTTMEPIILQLIPPERYAKTCYICQEIGKESRAHVGACMQCNKSGCKQQFHVTCAQALGLLCEEAGNYLDNVKYCGYCQYHYSKLKKGGNVKTIPPYKPVTHEAGSSDTASSPEKELEPILNVTGTAASSSSTSNIKLATIHSSSSSATSSLSSSSSSKQRKSGGSGKLSSSALSTASANQSPVATTSGGVTTGLSQSISSNSSSNKNSSSTSKEKDKHAKSFNRVTSSSKSQEKDSSMSARDKTSKSSKGSRDGNDHNISNHSLTVTSSNTSITISNLSGAGNLGGSSSKETFGQKFTSANLTDSVSVDMNAESLFKPNDVHNLTTIPPPPQQTQLSSAKNIGTTSNAKKRKSDTSKQQESTTETNKDIIKDVSVTLIPLPIEKGDASDCEKGAKKAKTEPNNSTLHATSESNLQNLNPNLIHTAAQGTGNKLSHAQLPTSSATIGTTYVRTTSQKETVENRIRSSSPRTPSGIISGSGNSTQTLYVSVPLSTATVPGINLPASTSLTEASISRNSPLMAHPMSNHLHGSISNSSQNAIERSSPRNHHTSNISNISQTQTSELSSQSFAQPPYSVLPSSSSPSVSHSTTTLASSIASVSTMESGGLKITYEKPNPRLMHLQEEQRVPIRRSRSQSGEGTNKSRSSKKRASANVVVSSAASSSLAAAMVAHSTAPSTSTGGYNGPSFLGATTTSVANIENATIFNDSNELLKNISSEKWTVDAALVDERSFKNNNNADTAPCAPSAHVATSVHSSNNKHANQKPLNKKLLRAQQSQSLNFQLLAQQPNTTQICSEESQKISTSSSYSRTPECGSIVGATNSSTIPNANANIGGLKFIFESQTSSAGLSNSSPVQIPQPVVKDSPPSSPESEAGSLRKRNKLLADSKDVKFFHNGVHATHMLGNQLNPASSVAQKMSDQLHMEIEAHGAYIQPNNDPGPQLVGIPFPGKMYSNLQTRSSSQSSGSNSLASMLGGAGANSATGNTAQSLEQLLERQWEQGSQFLMDQAQHFDIASLLCCLHQLKTENVRLEDHVNNLVARRDHLLAVNARLAIPLNSTAPQQNLSNVHINGPSSESSSVLNTSRGPRTNPHFNCQQIPLENGIDYRQQPVPGSNQSSIRHTSTNATNSTSTSSSSHSQLGTLTTSVNRQLPSSNLAHPTESIGRGRGTSNSSTTTIVPSGVGGGASYHNVSQQSAYSNIHQSQLRREDIQGKPS